MAKMKRLSLEQYQSDRIEDLMNKFFEYTNKFTEEVGKGGHFIDVHEWQILAANVIHEVDEEGWLHIAKEMYSWEKELINDYLEIYEEIQSGVRI